MCVCVCVCVCVCGVSHSPNRAIAHKIHFKVDWPTSRSSVPAAERIQMASTTGWGSNTVIYNFNRISHLSQISRCFGFSFVGALGGGAGESAVSACACISDTWVYPISGRVPSHHWHLCPLVSVCVCE